MEPALISTLAQYGPWGISAGLLVMNWFVIQKLFESLERMNNMLQQEMKALSDRLLRRPCLVSDDEEDAKR